MLSFNQSTIRNDGEGPKQQDITSVRTALEVIFILLTALLVLLALASSPLYICLMKKMKNAKQRQQDIEMNSLESTQCTAPDARSARVLIHEPHAREGNDARAPPKPSSLMSGTTIQDIHQPINPYDYGTSSSRRSSRDVCEQVNIIRIDNSERLGRLLTEQPRCIGSKTDTFDLAMTQALNAHYNTRHFQDEMVRIGARFHPYGLINMYESTLKSVTY